MTTTNHHFEAEVAQLLHLVTAVKIMVLVH